jgi:hypothetical protein
MEFSMGKSDVGEAYGMMETLDVLCYVPREIMHRWDYSPFH